MTRNLYIVRHGHREDFADSHWRASAQRPEDPGLSPTGIQQARELAQRLRSSRLDHIFSSPYLRAVQTASYVAQLTGIPVKIEAGLGEWLNPRWFATAPRCLSLAELNDRYPCMDLSYHSRVIRTWPEVNEQAHAWSAVRRATEAILSEFDGNILLVGHGSSVAGVACALRGERFPIVPKMCAIVQFQQDGAGWKMILDGCTRHLSVSEEAIRLW